MCQVCIDYRCGKEESTRKIMWTEAASHKYFTEKLFWKINLQNFQEVPCNEVLLQ